MTRKAPKSVGEIRSTKKLQLIHSDVSGPMQTETMGGKRYVITFTDDYSRCVAVHFMRQKFEALEKFKLFEATAVGDSGNQIGTLRTDNGGEYISIEFAEYLESRHIQHQTTVPHTPEQNGVAERMNRTLLEKARSMIAHADLPKSYWAEAVSTAAHLRNRLPTRALPDGVTPYERWYERKPDLSTLKVFGCIGYAHIPDPQRRKLDDKAVKLRFIGYSRQTKGYRMIDDATKKVYIRRDVTFNELDFGRKEVTRTEDQKAETLEITPNSETAERPKQVQPPVEIEPEEPRPERRRGPPVRFGIDEYADLAVTEHFAYRAYVTDEPGTIQEALATDEATQWKAAADDEYQSLLDNDTWDLVKLPRGRKAIGCKWVFKVKHDGDGEVERFKGRLVAKGYSQKYGIDYDETFSPVVRFSSIRTLLALAVQKGMLIHQMDVVTAFLNGRLEEEIYMQQPEGYITPGSEDLVCRLKKSLYGLKQSPRCWNKEFQEYMKSTGFTQCTADPCVFVRVIGDNLTIVAVYVDDLILVTVNQAEMDELKEALACRFKMKDMGELHYCLGISVVQDKKNGCLGIHQKQYIQKMLEKFKMVDAKTVTTPADINVKLVKDDGVSRKVDQSHYQSIVGSLLYAAIATRPDIAQAVSAVSKFSAEPTEAHLTAVKRILRYLKGTMDLSLQYRSSDCGELIGYSDSDWAGNLDDRHSTSGCLAQLSGGAISWLSKKQATVALSTAEAEYIALSATTQEVVWLRRLLNDLGAAPPTAATIMEDNQGAIALGKNPVNHARTKHIDIWHHYVREAVEDHVIDLEYCPTKKMIADLLTKPLPKTQFETLRLDMGLRQGQKN